MKLSRFGRISMALVVSVAVGLGMTACGGGTVGFMWVLGTQYNQIAGFKIDDYTGNLTNLVGSPYSSSGTNPVSIVVKTGGRFVYVINKGNGTAATPGNIILFSVGGDGNLTFQQSYSSAGQTPVWAALGSGGGFLYVLDQFDPTNLAGSGVAPTGTGDVTVFASDPNTGRLSLVQNQQSKNAAGLNIDYFPVGKTPTMVQISGSCVYSLNAGDSTVTPYSVGGSGQLTAPTNSTLQVGLNPEGNVRTLTSINTGGTYTFITDATPIVGTGSTIPASPGGQILEYTTGTNCALNTVVGSPTNNLALTSNPTNSFTETRGNYVYVLNTSTTNTSNPANSSISAFSINTAGQLQPVSNSSNPFSTGSGPRCMVEDPTSQYLYTSNNVDGTVTGKFINKNTGELSQLSRGSTFTATGLVTCLAVSGNVD
jgi:6-phosphogluconolactonase (cycloisomerase 2 family)